VVKQEDVSKAVSHALRHEPWLYELELDDEGWASIEAVLAALRVEREDWQDLTPHDLERMVESSTKRRHEIRGGRIRALYGHSLSGRLRRERASPPATLFHGTRPDASRTILVDGLKRMGRQYVHLSVDAATAREVGRRKAKTPTILVVDAAAAHASGVPFYVGNEMVWLADHVPGNFLSVVHGP
jgi:putative RNA 2'-phosphotransferase